MGALRALLRAVRGNLRHRVRLPLAARHASGSRSSTTADGRRLAVKDLFDTAGVRTTYGSAVFADHVPARLAEGVALLERAGWVNVGKTNLHEFAYGVTSQNLHYGVVPNPRSPGPHVGRVVRWIGGGAGAGLADAALGTDTGGSIRIPAACCGIVGFKPTYGLVPTDGVFPLAPTSTMPGRWRVTSPAASS